MTTSFPAVGQGGVTADAWASTFGARDGLVEDYLGNAFDLTLLNDTNEASFTAANISNNGYTLVVGNGERVSLPAPTSGSKTYYIGNLYDPALQVPLAGTGTDPVTNPAMADPNGPCRLRAFDTVDLTNGKRLLVQWVLTRTAGKALTDSVVVDRRRWVGVPVEYSDDITAAGPGNEGNYPRGSIAYDPNNGRLVVRTVDDSGAALMWLDPSEEGPFAIPLSSGFIARSGKSAPPEYYRSGATIGLQGQVQRSSGNLSNGNTVTIGQMPEGRRPKSTRSFICRCGGTNNYTEVRVNTDGTTDGRILMTDPPSSTTWLDLSPISYRIGA